MNNFGLVITGVNLSVEFFPAGVFQLVSLPYVFGEFRQGADDLRDKF